MENKLLEIEKRLKEEYSKLRLDSFEKRKPIIEKLNIIEVWKKTGIPLEFSGNQVVI